MRISGLRCYALTIGVAAAMLAGCGGSQPPIRRAEPNPAKMNLSIASDFANGV